MKLLFICTHNRCRSIMAEAIANDRKSSGLSGFSAGSSPQNQVHPLSLKYLQEHGIKTDALKSQSWHDFETLKPDAIITLCDRAASEVCPVWFDDSLVVHWGLSDPSAEKNESEQEKKFHYTIDLLSRRLDKLIEKENIELRGDKLGEVLTDLATFDIV